MKRIGLLFAAVAVLAGGVQRATAAPLPSITISVDENGNGTFVSNVTGMFTLPFALKADPGPGGLPSVLTYDLLGPPSLVAGDVQLTEGGVFADVIRFNPAGTGGNLDYRSSLLFYSDSSDGVDSIGDTPTPPLAFYTNLISIPEVGPEGANGATYTPTDGQPGFIAGFNVTYDFVSDGTLATPEPASVTLLGLGVAGIAVRAWRRKALV
jgi:hypothetical protein